MTDTTSAAPVAWRVHPFDYGIGHEGVYAMTMLEQQRDAWLRKGWKVEPLYVAPPAVVEPPHQPKRTVTYVCPVCAASLERQE